MKLFAASLMFCAVAFSGTDESPAMRARFQSTAVEVQTAASTVHPPALPGFTNIEHFVSISITTTDFSASSFCVDAIVELQDGTNGGATKCVDKDSLDRPVTLQFSTGSVKPVRWLRLIVTRMHAEPTDQLVNIFRH